MFAYNHKRKKKDTILLEMYSDTLDMDISFDAPLRRPMLFSREMFDVLVCPMDVKGLSTVPSCYCYTCVWFVRSW